MNDRLSAYAPQALAILRIVTGVLFIHGGVVVLFNIPASTYPPPPPEMSTLMTIAGVLELVGGLLDFPRVPDASGRVHPVRHDGGRLLGFPRADEPVAGEQSRRRGDPLLLHLLLPVLRRAGRLERRRRFAADSRSGSRYFATGTVAVGSERRDRRPS